MSISVSNLSIDTIPYTNTAVRVVNGHPTISWTFVGNVVVTPDATGHAIQTSSPSSQTTYEIRIATSSANLGTDSFTGNIAATGVVTSGTTAWRYNGYSIARGTTYFGQIRVQDAYGNTSSWSTFSIKYNTPPIASGVLISPANPTTQDNLTLTYNYTDADSDAESGTKIRWFRNGVWERRLDGYKTVESRYLITGDLWTAQVTASDGYELGIASGSATVTVGGILPTPTITIAKIVPQSPTYLDPLFAYYQSAGNDEVSIRWYLNNVLVADANDHRFYRFNTKVGDTIRFEAFASHGASVPAVSQTLTIAEPTFRIFNIRVNGRVME